MFCLAWCGKPLVKPRYQPGNPMVSIWFARPGLVKSWYRSVFPGLVRQAHGSDPFRAWYQSVLPGLERFQPVVHARSGTGRVAGFVPDFNPHPGRTIFAVWEVTLPCLVGSPFLFYLEK